MTETTLDLAKAREEIAQITERNLGLVGFRRDDAMQLLGIVNRLIEAVPEQDGHPHPQWHKLAVAVEQHARTYRRLADQSWEVFNTTDAVRYRGMAEGLHQARATMRQLSPDPVFTLSATNPASMSVLVGCPDGDYRLPVAPAHPVKCRIDRVTSQLPPAGRPGEHLLKITVGVDAADFQVAVPPPLLGGQTHIGFVYVLPAVNMISNRAIHPAVVIHE